MTEPAPTTAKDPYRDRVDAIFGDALHATVRQVSKALSMNEKTLRELLADETLPFRMHSTGGKTSKKYIVIDDVYTYLHLEPRPIPNTTGE